MFGGDPRKQLESHAVSHARAELVKALATYSVEDGAAELDHSNFEARAELVGSIRNVDDFVKAHGLDPGDIWGIDKKLSGENLLKQALGFRPEHGNPGHQEFQNFAARLQAEVVLPYGASKHTGDALIQSLGRSRDARSAEALLQGSRTGSVMEGHAAAIQHLMGLGSSLDIGIYDFNSVPLLAALESRRDLSSVRMTTDQSQFTRGQSLSVGKALGWLADNRGLRLNETQGPFEFARAHVQGMLQRYQSMKPGDTGYAAAGADFWNYHTHDHYKVVVAGADFVRAGDAITDEVRALQGLWLGSANFTSGAMGQVIDRHGNASMRRRGVNIERSFLMDKDSIGREVSTELFDSLMRQATTAADWIHAREYNRGQLDYLGTEQGFSDTANFLSSGLKTRLLTNAGFSDVASQLFARLGEHGGEAFIFANRFGKSDDDGVRKMLRGALSHEATRIQVLMKHVTDLTDSHGAKEFLRMQEFLAGLDAGQRSRIDVVYARNENVHAKGGVFRFHDGTVVDLANGSTNWADSSIVNDQWGPEAPHRNLNIVTSSEDYAGTLGAFTDVRNVFGAIALTTSTRVGTRGLQGLDRARERAMFRRYGLNPGQARFAAVDDGHVARFTVGGSFFVGGGVIDLGNMKTLTATQVTDDSAAKGFGFGGQVFVPELTKFIASGRGITYDVKGDRYTSAISPESVGALEILAAGTAAVNEDIKEVLEELVRAHGLESVRSRLQDPVLRGRLRMQAVIKTRKMFGNFQGPEPGKAAYGAKAFSELGFRVSSKGLLDMNAHGTLDAWAMDKALSGTKKGFGLGTKEFFFMAGGLSSHGSDGLPTPARFFDAQALNTLPVAYMHEREGQTSDFMFLMPFSKMAQLPQRLQNIMSARNLDPVSADIARAMGVSSGGQELVGTSRFAGAKGDPMTGIRIRGYAIAGLTGDNAYMIGERFQDAYFADTSWRKTVKIQHSSQVMGDPGRVFVDAVRDMAGVGHALDLGDDRFLINHEVLAEMGHSLGVSRHYIADSQLTMLQELAFGTDKTPGTSLMLDLKVGRGLSVVNEGGVSSFTVTGATVRRLTSGDRSILGGKFPMAFVQEQSRAIQAIHGVVRGLNPTMHTNLGFDSFNAVFGMGTIKTGQALIETGIETISTREVYQQLEYLKNNVRIDNFADFSTLIGRIGGFVDPSSGVGSEFQALAKQLSGLKDGTASREAVFKALEERFSATEAHLATGDIVRMGRSGGGHVGTAALAFGVHALYYASQFEAADDATKQRFYSAFAASGTKNVAYNRMSLADMPVQAILGVVPLSFIGAASSTAVAMSSQNRVNLLNYHAGGYTDAFFDLMAMAPAVKNRASAYQELVTGGLLGRGGVDNVVFAWEYNPMSKFRPGLEVEVDGKTVNPFGESLRDLELVRGVWGGDAVDEKVFAKLSARIGQQGRMQAALKELMSTRVFGEPVYSSEGGTTSSSIQSALAIAEDAGQGGRTLLIPKIGRREKNHFRFDAGAHENVSFMLEEVVFLSAKSQMALGSFGDYSHDIQRLQRSIEEKMYVLGFLGTDTVFGDGRDIQRSLSNHMGIFEQAAYRQLLQEVGELKVVQREAAVTAMQKQLGGQLALPGHNMVIGTMPEVSEGTMVLGKQAWADIREHIVEELRGGLGKDVSFKGVQRLALKAAREAGSHEARSKALAVLRDLRGNAGAATADSGALDVIFKQKKAALDLAYDAKREAHAMIQDAYDIQFDNLKQRTNAELDRVRAELEAVKARRTGEVTSWKTLELQSLNAKLEHGIRNVDTGRKQALANLNELYNQRLAATLAETAGLTRDLVQPLQQELLETRAFVSNSQAELSAHATNVSQRDNYVVRYQNMVSAGQGDTPEAQQLKQLADRYRLAVQSRNNRMGRMARGFDAVTRGQVAAAGFEAQDLYERMLEAHGLVRADHAERVAGIADDHITGLRNAGVAATLTERAIKGEDLIARTGVLTTADERTRTINTEIAEWRANRMKPVSVVADLERERLRIQRRVDRESADTKAAAIIAPLSADVDELEAQLGELKRGSKDAVTALVNEALASLVENADMRDVLARGGFQRAGAPMGPLALSAMRLRTVSEFNATNPALSIFEELSDRAVFLNIGAMGYNLGDFDGDTGSVFLLHQFSKLKAKELRGELINETERAVFDAARGQLRWSEAELVFAHARHYSGLDMLYSEEALYFGGNEKLKNKGVGDARRFLHDLEDSVEKLARVRGVDVTTALADGASYQQLFKGQQHLGMDAGEAFQHWKGFRDRKDIAKNLGIASNAYVDEQYKTQRLVEGYIHENLNRFGLAGTIEQRQAFLFKEYFRTQAGSAALKAVTGSLLGSLTDQGDGKALTSNQIITFFSMTSLASTGLISRVFEASYALDSYAASIRAGYRANLVDAGNAHGSNTTSAAVAKARLTLAATWGMDDGAAGVLADFAKRDEYHSRIAGLGLMLQQMSREAIKPKGKEDMVDDVRRRIGYSEESNVVASAVDKMMDSSRVKGLNLFQALVTGKNLDGTVYDVSQLKVTSHKIEQTYDHVQLQIKNAIVDFFKGQVDSLWGAGAADPARLEKLFGGDIPEALKATSDVTEQKAAVAALIEHRAMASARLLIDNAINIQGITQQRQSYLGALASEDPAAFTRTAARMTTQAKLHIIGTTAARGKFNDPNVMARALENVFADYTADEAGIEKLRADASRAQGSELFADRMVGIFEAYIAGADTQTAMRRGHAKSRLGYQQKEAVYAGVMRDRMSKMDWNDEHKARLETASAKELSAMYEARATAEPDAIKAHVKDEEFNRARANIMAATLYDVMSTGHNQAPGVGAPRPALTGVGDALSPIEKLGKSGAFGGLSGNFVVPAIGALAFGGGLAFMPGAAHAATGDTAGTVGEVAGMGYAFANPQVMLRTIMSSAANHREGLVMAAIATGSMAAGVIAGHKAYEHVASAIASSKVDDVAGKVSGRAGFGGAIAAGVAGLVAGGGLGVIATALAQKAGWISHVNPIPEIMASLSGPGVDDTAADAAAADELLGFEEGESAEGLVTIQNADGEVVHQDFYWFSWAAVEGEDGGLGDSLEAGLDDFIAHAEYDVQTVAKDEALMT